METSEEFEEGEIPGDEFRDYVDCENGEVESATMEFENNGYIADNSNNKIQSKFLVHAIRNRRQKRDGTFNYLVEWVGKYKNSWEPEVQLLEDGFANEIRLVDTRLESPPFRKFKIFCKRYLNGQNYIAASADGRCAFRAVIYACNILQNDSWFSHNLIQAYEAKCTSKGVPLTKDGVPIWTIIHDFQKR